LKLSDQFIRLKREIIGLLQHLPEPDHDRRAMLENLVSTSIAETSTHDH
jgi:hypothetical protein